MNDLRNLAKVIVERCCAVKPGERVLVEATGCEDALAAEVLRAVYDAGGAPFYNQMWDSLQSAWLERACEESVRLQAAWDAERMRSMDVYIGLRSSANAFDLSAIPSGQSRLYRREYETPVHFQTRVPKTRWLVTRIPNASMAQTAGMPTREFEEFYYRCCCLGYDRFRARMEPLAAAMRGARSVRIKGEGVDLRFEMCGAGVAVCSGTRNIPAGEVFSAPSPGSVEGYIRYNVPASFNGSEFKGVRLEFDHGRISRASCESGDGSALEAIFDTDGGARMIGEFAIGTNPFIDRITGDILFDEKASGSFHLTPGNSYDGCGNGNRSGIHWDLVYRMHGEYGGAELWFDDTLISRNGLFVPDALQPLNPENLCGELEL